MSASAQIANNIPSFPAQELIFAAKRLYRLARRIEQKAHNYGVRPIVEDAVEIALIARALMDEAEQQTDTVSFTGDPRQSALLP